MIRLALQNARAHRGQAAALMAATTVATAVVTAAFLAGGAAEGGIRQAAIQSLGEVDLLVRTPGGTAFPETLAAELQQIAEARGGAAAPALLLVGAATTADQGEPRAALLALAPGAEGLGELPPRPGAGVAINERLADRLGAAAGDRIRLALLPAADPARPVILVWNGTAGVTGSGTTVDVRPDARDLLVLLAWRPTAAEDLDLRITRPDGTTTDLNGGGPASPDSPVFHREPAREGTWRFHVTGDPATAGTAYTLAVVQLVPSDAPVPLPREIPPELAGLIPQPTTLELAVARVVPARGLANLFSLPLVIVSLDQAQALLDQPDQVNLVLVSGPGGTSDPQVAAALEEPLQAAANQWPGLQVEPIKASWLADAEEAGGDFTRALSTLSAFTVASAALLVVSLLTMVAQERRREWGVLRALGLQRRRLAGLAVAEAAIVAAPGLVPGMALGLGLAWALIGIVNRYIATDGGLPIPFVLDPTAFVQAAIVLLAVLAITLGAGAWHVTRFHVASAVRGIPDPERHGPRWQPAAVGGGAALTGAGLVLGSHLLLLTGPVVALTGTAHLLPLGARRWPAAALVSIAYLLWTVPNFHLSRTEAPFVGPLRGTLLSLLAVTLIVTSPAVTSLLRGIARRGRYAVPRLLAATYPVERRGRTITTATMFALVILILSLFSTFFAILVPDPQREAAGWDLLGSTTVPLDDPDATIPPQLRDRIAALAVLPTAVAYGTGAVTVNGEPADARGPPTHWIYGLTPEYAAMPHPLLRSFTEEDPYAAVRAGRGALVSRIYDIDDRGFPEGLEPGDRLALRDLPGRSWPILGVQNQVVLAGIFLPANDVEERFPQHSSTLLVRARPGVDTDALARDLERALLPIGGDVQTIPAYVDEFNDVNEQAYLVIQVYLGLGLVVGISSLGVMMAKAAEERSHELGVLRALGLSRRETGAALVLEALSTAGYGVVPGIAVGLAVAWAVWNEFVRPIGAPFVVPVVDLLVLTLIATVAAVAATLPTARRVARAAPGPALRMDV